MTGFLSAQLDDDRIERRAKNGRNDRGDVTGIKTIRGGRVVVEVKDYNGEVKVKPWLDEAEIERGNDDAAIGVVVFKRRGIGYNNAAQHGVLMTLETFAQLLEGGTDT
ncbi:hypothetical protein [Cryobacterium sp. BB736]|uniref:hypothetical protein n=1 Tax=Cryobacterium sp. BB736 TaxID=2746963 RepID=UPI00351C5D10